MRRDRPQRSQRSESSSWRTTQSNPPGPGRPQRRREGETCAKPTTTFPKNPPARSLLLAKPLVQSSTRKTPATRASLGPLRIRRVLPGYFAIRPAELRVPGLAQAVWRPRSPRPPAIRRPGKPAISIDRSYPLSVSHFLLFILPQVRQQRCQFPAGIKQPGHDRPNRTAHRRSDLFVFHFL